MHPKTWSCSSCATCRQGAGNQCCLYRQHLDVMVLSFDTIIEYTISIYLV